MTPVPLQFVDTDSHDFGDQLGIPITRRLAINAEVHLRTVEGVPRQADTRDMVKMCEEIANTNEETWYAFLCHLQWLMQQGRFRFVDPNALKK